jgi:hypothetical protein
MFLTTIKCSFPHILILSHRGSTQKKIEEEMGVKIILPSSKKDDSISKFLGVVIIM